MEKMSPKRGLEVHKSRKDDEPREVIEAGGNSSIKSSYQTDTKLSVVDSKFNKMLKSPTLEAHPRLEKKTRLMGSRSLDRSKEMSDPPSTNFGCIPKSKFLPNNQDVPEPLIVDTIPKEQIVEILKYSNDSPQLNKGSIIYIEHDDDENSSFSKISNELKEQQRASFDHVEQHISFDKAVELQEARPKTQSPTIRRKSDSEQQVSMSNHIVSILKRKDIDSSSTSSNASPVTFSPSVVDTPVRNTTKQGILKKRSSLDESRYSRSHSPDDRSILIKHSRRNSLEETHGILKQPSVESKDESCHGSHGILKKKESITPSGEPKHVSISQAVIMAAAEICKDIVNAGGIDDSLHDIKPILKQDSQSHTPANNGQSQPKPILKKKHSSDGEELMRNFEESIRPILKSSRKSSRDENSDTDTESCNGKRSILKTDSPAKRNSYCDPFETNIIMQRSKSLENQTNQTPKLEIHASPERVELPLISVAERIKSMEQFLGKTTPISSSSSGKVVPKSAPVHRREFSKDRFKTHPVTVDELSS